MDQRQSFHIGIKCLITRQRKNLPAEILLFRDAGSGKWETPGGRINAHETDIQAALRREISEEIPGAKLISFGPPVHTAISEFLVENNHRLFLVFYAAKITLNNQLQTLSSEHSELGWFTRDQLQEIDIYPADKQAALKHLRV